MSVTFTRTIPAVEYISNNSFEDDDLYWTLGGSAVISTLEARTGIKSVRVPPSTSGSFTQILTTPILETSLNVEAVYIKVNQTDPWAWDYLQVTVTYDDSSTQNNILVLYSSLWYLWNFATSPYIKQNKNIISIKIERLTTSLNDIYFDDVSLFKNSVIYTYQFDAPISWEEKQECKPAIRDVPINNDGSYIDVGTFKLKARILNISIRLTDDNKNLFQIIFDEHTSITITAQINDDSETWTYDAWLTKKPVIYEYKSRGGGALREWRADLEFKIRSISYG